MSQRRNKSQIRDEGDDMPDLDEYITECVRYIVCREGSKIPIKRADIQKHLTTVREMPGNQFNNVLIGANRKLKQVYGYKLIQVGVSKSGIQYIVVLSEKCSSLASTATNPHHRQLLVAALTHIFMSGSPVKEEEMWKFLKEAHLLDENDHNGRKVLTNLFTKQLYLTYTKEGEGDLARHVFDWGQRATEEIPKMFILQKFATALNKEPSHWAEQYRIASMESY